MPFHLPVNARPRVADGSCAGRAQPKNARAFSRGLERRFANIWRSSGALQKISRELRSPAIQSCVKTGQTQSPILQHRWAFASMRPTRSSPASRGAPRQRRQRWSVQWQRMYSHRPRSGARSKNGAAKVPPKENGSLMPCGVWRDESVYRSSAVCGVGGKGMTKDVPPASTNATTSWRSIGRSPQSQSPSFRGSRR